MGLSAVTKGNSLRTHDGKLRAQVFARGARALAVPWPGTVRLAPSPAATKTTGWWVGVQSSPMCGAGRQPRSSPHIGGHGCHFGRSLVVVLRCALILKPMRARQLTRLRHRTDATAAWHARACSLCARGCCDRGRGHRHDHRLRRDRPRRHPRHCRSRRTHHRRVGVRRSSVAGARAARAARRGGARAGDSSGARVCFTRRCARGSACARRVTRAAARSFAARRRPAATRPPTLQVTILSCGMVCACAQARARLLQRRPRSSPPL